MGYPMTCQSGGTLDIFIEPVMPKDRLVVVGKTAIARARCGLAARVGFDVIVAAPGGRREDFVDARDWLDDLDDVAGLKPAPAAAARNASTTSQPPRLAASAQMIRKRSIRRSMKGNSALLCRFVGRTHGPAPGQARGL